MTNRAYPGTLPGLTSLRFFAAIAVVAYHFVWWLPAIGEPIPVVPLISEGHLAVDFFFVLSGFILTHAHLRQIRTTGLEVRPFLVKRLARIYPMHLATLLFFVALIGVLDVVGLHLLKPERYNSEQFLLNLLLMQGWETRDTGAWNFPSWSVSAEWFAYLLFPVLSSLIVLRLARLRAELLVAAALAFLVACWAAAPLLLRTDFFDLHSNFGYVRILPEFLLGIALYRLGTERRLAALEGRWAMPLIGAAIFVAALLQWELPLVLLLSTLILAAAETSRQGRRGWLAASGMIYLGEISYSVYMVHVPVATVLLRGAIMMLGRLPVWVIPPAMLVTVAVAMVSHRLIEVPGRRLIARLGTGPRVQAITS